MKITWAQYEILKKLHDDGRTAYLALTSRGYNANAIRALRTKGYVKFIGGGTGSGRKEVIITSPGNVIVDDLAYLYNNIPEKERGSFKKHFPELVLQLK